VEDKNNNVPSPEKYKIEDRKFARGGLGGEERIILKSTPILLPLQPPLSMNYLQDLIYSIQYTIALERWYIRLKTEICLQAVTKSSGHQTTFL